MSSDFKLELLLIGSKTINNGSSLKIISDIFETINSSPLHIV
jgi:hypothetical protein